MAPRRTRSEMDLLQAQKSGPEYPEGEFYTAIGPDGDLHILLIMLFECTYMYLYQVNQCQ
jgi:hypothetical protein